MPKSANKKSGTASRKRSGGPAARPSAAKPRISVKANYCEFPDCDSCVARGVKLGRYHTYNAVLGAPEDRGQPTALLIGCRVFHSADEARAHWKGRNDRPRAAELIRKATAVAKQMRWRWARA